ncbi:hypothetical protein CL628_01380 [bacterium]|nr:hypothetical protein [bacterium]|tara:strand:- start:977 stop:1519 length:543 start_codon:yes stop_codon:yes gene_type:complete
MKNIGIIIGIIVVVLVLFGAWSFISTPPAGDVDEVAEIGEHMDDDDAMVKTPTSATAPETASAPAADPGETATLLAISPYTGTGVATRSFDGTVFTHAIAADLPGPAAGTFYEGWLVHKTASGPQFFSTGKLVNSGGTAWTLVYSAAQDYPDHKDVVVTEETEADGLDNKPEAHVLEGTF